MSKYTKIVTQQGTVKTSESIGTVERKLEETDKKFIEFKPYGNNDFSLVNPEKVTLIREK